MRSELQITPDAVIEVLSGLVAPLAAALGGDTEVVLHDLRQLDHSLVAIGGDVTGRSVGAPATELILHHLQTGGQTDMLSYRTQTKTGRKLRSSTIFLRDDLGTPFACLCVNTDVTALLGVADALDAALASMTGGLGGTADSGQPSEDFVVSVDDLVVSAMDRAIQEVGIPIEFMQKSHRTEVVRQLDSVGFFLIKDAVGYAAKALQVSPYSIYKYLRELPEGDSEFDDMDDEVLRDDSVGLAGLHTGEG